MKITTLLMRPVIKIPEDINHQEAYELACIKKQESNLARCYIELRNELKLSTSPKFHNKPLTHKHVEKLIHDKHFSLDYKKHPSDEMCLNWYRLGLRDGEAAHGIIKNDKKKQHD